MKKNRNSPSCLRLYLSWPMLALVAIFFLSSGELGLNSITWAEEPDTKGECEGVGYPNPAAVYCNKLGYQTEVVTSEDGGEHSVCIFPDGSSCSAWRFFEGKCGEEFSFCAKQGLKQIIKTDGKNPFSPHYAVCADGKRELGNPADLMGITGNYEDVSRMLPQDLMPSFPPEEPATPRSLPSSFTWRNHDGHDWITPHEDQSDCGSCWGMSAVGVTEAVYNITTNLPNLDLDLSEEELNSDCLLGHSCCGGWHHDALDYMRDTGIVDEECFPYDTPFYATGDCGCFGTGNCPMACPNRDAGPSHQICNNLNCVTDMCADAASRVTTISSWHHVTGRDNIKQRLIDEGPLSVCFGYRNFFWDDDDIGRCDPTPTGYTHCVVIFGFDDDGEYWMVKDSYGDDSGPHATGDWEMGYGECLIETLVYWVEPDDVNFPPRADANGPYSEECQGATTDVQLDGTGSWDANAGDTLDYSWTDDCPGGSFIDDSTSATPILTVDTSFAECSTHCNVTLTVTDDDGRTDSDSSEVSVYDTTAPDISCPLDIIVECTGGSGIDPGDPQLAGFFAGVSATDDCDSSPVITYSIPSFFPLGTTVVNFTATDSCGNFSTCSPTVTVEDTIPPDIFCPDNITVECTGNCEIQATDPQLTDFFAGVSATDICDSSPTIVIDAPAFFPIGMTPVLFTAYDDSGNTNSCIANVTVVDTTPPEIEVTLSDYELWPPNHKMVNIDATVLVTDVCDPNASFVLTSIASDEPENGLGDGDQEPDIAGADFGTADTEFQLRSERSGLGDGRTYTIVYTAYDSCNTAWNLTTETTVLVEVPHDQSGHANSAGGFSEFGASFAKDAKVFKLVVLSTPTFNARQIYANRTKVGTNYGTIDPLQASIMDLNRDGMFDFVAVFSVQEAEELRARSPGKRGRTMAFRYGTRDGTYYLVPNIFQLGPPIE